jgi:sulfate permease, SulP family
MTRPEVAAPSQWWSADRLVPTAVAGGFLGVLETLLAISFGGLIFVGVLGPHAGTGIGMALFAALVFLVVVAVGSSLPGAIGSVQDVTAAVLVVVAAGVAAQFQPGDPRLVGTVIAAVAITSLLTGLTLWVLGALRLGQLVRFVPYPVIGGFLAGTGWLLLTGGLGLLASRDVPLRNLGIWTDQSFLLLVLPGIAIALVLLLGIRLGAGTNFLPIVCVAAIVLFYAVVLLGPGVSAAEDGGWLLGPFPEGALWPPDLALLAAIDVEAIVSQVVGIITVVVLSAMALLLTISGLELSTGRELELDRELRVAGIANVVAAAGGGIPGYHGLSLTNLAYRTGAAVRATGLVAAGIVAVTLVFSGEIVALAPRPVVGGLVVFLGLAFLVEWLIDGWSRLLRTDYAVVVLILVVIATVGFLQGVAVGIAATIVLFLVSYTRADVVRHALDGAAYPSQVDRPPEDIERLAELGGAITILELQGFLFFGTAHRLLDLIRERLQESDQGVAFLVLDFRHVTGLDSSTVMSFQKAAQLALRHDATIVLSGLRGRVAEQVERGELAELDRVRVETELDRAVQWCEDQLLASRRDAGADAITSLRERLSADLGSPELAERLLDYLDREEVAAGEVVIAQGERSRALYFLESGTLTAVLADAKGHTRRLRTMMPGTVVGEVAMYLDTPRSASVVAETDSVVSRLSGDALDRMQHDDPDLASALHQLLARQLASRLASTLRTIESLGN